MVSNNPAPLGNKYAVGRSASRGKPVTQRIISKLNEVNKDTKKEYIADLVDELFRQALPVKILEQMPDGTTKETFEPGDLSAIEMIMNRSDGKAVQPITGAENGGLTVVFQSKDKNFL